MVRVSTARPKKDVACSACSFAPAWKISSSICWGSGPMPTPWARTIAATRRTRSSATTRIPAPFWTSPCPARPCACSMALRRLWSRAARCTRSTPVSNPCAGLPAYLPRREMKPEPVSDMAADESRDERAEGEPIDPPALDLSDQPPVDRYCDVVLTGGVTDGVIYPWAVVELARKYRFKNIGGTSVGAMAAALTAAAEFARRRGSVAGFNEVLLKLPRMLGDQVNGATRLYSLFQPANSTRRLFELFVRIFAAKSTADGKRATGGWLNKMIAAL